jgi:hypothetical protein
MARAPGSDKNAERAVALFQDTMRSRGYSIDEAWKAIVTLLLTCEIWRTPQWIHFHGVPVFRESNDYRKSRLGTPNKALDEGMRIANYIADKLGVSRDELCSHLGGFLRSLNVQPNNPRGHAFRSIVGDALAAYGDPGLTIEEEVSPYDLFTGIQFHSRSDNPRIDLVVHRGNKLVALCSVRWSYRHDRVDMIDEAQDYLPAARKLNRDCLFFGITAELNPARLRKVVNQTEPMARHAAITRLVHLHVPIATHVIGHNSELVHLLDLADWVRDSSSWR